MVGVKNLNTERIVIVGFKEESKVVKIIDKLADAEGLNRSNFLRHIIREKIKQNNIGM